MHIYEHITYIIHMEGLLTQVGSQAHELVWKFPKQCSKHIKIIYIYHDVELRNGFQAPI